MANWRDIKNNFRVDQLLGLNVKLLRKTKVYYSPINEPTIWAGWELQAGQITGKLFSWVNDTPANQNYPPLDVDGLWLMFYLNDNWNDPNEKAYYIKIESKLIDWNYTKDQLDAQRRSNMNWYENLLEDFDTAISDYKNEVSDYVTNALWVGGSIVAVMFYWNFIGKYQVQAKVYKGVVKDVIKEVKA